MGLTLLDLCYKQWWSAYQYCYKGLFKARGRKEGASDENAWARNTWAFSSAHARLSPFFFLTSCLFVPNPPQLICLWFTVPLYLLPLMFYSPSGCVCQLRLFPSVSLSPVCFYILSLASHYPPHPLHCRYLTVTLSSYDCCSILIWIFCSETDSHMLLLMSWFHFTLFTPFSFFFSIVHWLVTLLKNLFLSIYSLYHHWHHKIALFVLLSLLLCCL